MSPLTQGLNYRSACDEQDKLLTGFGRPLVINDYTTITMTVVMNEICAWCDHALTCSLFRLSQMYFSL